MNDPMNENPVLQGEQFEYDFEAPPAVQSFSKSVGHLPSPASQVELKLAGRRQRERRRAQPQPLPMATHILRDAASQAYAPPVKARRCSCGMQRELEGVPPGSQGGRWIRVRGRIILLGV